jgi:hypothetical protein
VIARDNDTSNDRNANTPTANVIDEMIRSMPPHVRAVAERRRDLMYKLFSEREEPRSSVLRPKLSTDDGGGPALCVRGGYFA